jgi:hypothetical protein
MTISTAMSSSPHHHVWLILYRHMRCRGIGWDQSWLLMYDCYCTFVMLNACYYSPINLICGTKLLHFIIYIGFGIDLLGVCTCWGVDSVNPKVIGRETRMICSTLRIMWDLGVLMVCSGCLKRYILNNP